MGKERPAPPPLERESKKGEKTRGDASDARDGHPPPPRRAAAASSPRQPTATRLHNAAGARAASQLSSSATAAATNRAHHASQRAVLSFHSSPLHIAPAPLPRDGLPPSEWGEANLFPYSPQTRIRARADPFLLWSLMILFCFMCHFVLVLE